MTPPPLAQSWSDGNLQNPQKALLTVLKVSRVSALQTPPAQLHGAQYA